MPLATDERIEQLRQLDRLLDLLEECAEILRSLDASAITSFDDDLLDSLRRFVRDALAELRQEDGRT